MRILEKIMVVVGNKNILSNLKFLDIIINFVSIFLKGDKFKGG